MAMVLFSLKKKSMKGNITFLGYSQSNYLFLMITAAVTKSIDQFAVRETQITKKKKKKQQKKMMTMTTTKE